MSISTSGVKRAFSVSSDEKVAVREFYHGLDLAEGDTELVIFFCSPDYDTDLLEKELNRRFGDITLIGCTTAGEITPEGYHDGSLTGAAFSKDHFTCISHRRDEISTFSIKDGIEFGRAIIDKISAREKNANGSNSFAFLLIDGLSGAEERVTASVGCELGEISMVGGSTADAYRMKRTQLFHEGHFREDSAVIILFNTDLPFRVAYTHHYLATDAKAVITEADAVTREVTEINGLPVLQEYARLCGLKEEELVLDTACRHPFLIKIGGHYYSRGIININHENGSIKFACAIDKGVVFSIARPGDPQKNLKALFKKIEADIGPLEIVLGCDCAARKVAFENAGILDEMSKIYADHNVIGFATFGEQVNTLHMNNSFSCVAIGRAS